MLHNLTSVIFTELVKPDHDILHHSSLRTWVERCGEKCEFKKRLNVKFEGLTPPIKIICSKDNDRICELKAD